MLAHETPQSWLGAVRPVILILSLTAIAALSAKAQGTPHAEFPNSTLTGANNMITATRVPVVDSTGAIHYRDITLLFDVEDSSSAGVSVTLASGYPTVVP